MRLALALFVALAAACSSSSGPPPDASCIDACAKLRSCSFKTTGFACSDPCPSNNDTSCAQCINQSTCEDIRVHACVSACGFAPQM